MAITSPQATTDRAANRPHARRRCLTVSSLAAALLAAASLHAGDDEKPSAVQGERVWRVAVCQTLCIDSDVEGNLRRVEYAVEAAARQGARLACFPETAVLGWINAKAHELAEPIPGRLSDRIAALAREHHLMIAIGLSEKVGDRLYDAAILVGADGRILHKHRKINTLRELLDPPYTRGTPENVTVVDTPLGRIGMLVCADTFKDDLVQRLAAQSPDLVIVPYGWAADVSEWPQHGERLAAWVSSVARRTQCPVVGVDLVGVISAGPWQGKTYGGQSVVAGGKGELLGVLKDRDPDVRVFDLTLRRFSNP